MTILNLHYRFLIERHGLFVLQIRAVSICKVALYEQYNWKVFKLLQQPSFHLKSAMLFAFYDKLLIFLTAHESE